MEILIFAFGSAWALFGLLMLLHGIYVLFNERFRPTDIGVGIETKMLRGTEGFSLLELLIVVGIILIIATIAIPSLLRSRQSANESSAVANVRTVNIEQANYSVSAGGNFGTLAELVSAGMLDSRFNGIVSGYAFTMTVSGPDYTVSATPTGTNNGRYGYYSTPDGVVRYQTTTSATCTPCFPSGLSGAPVK